MYGVFPKMWFKNYVDVIISLNSCLYMTTILEFFTVCDEDKTLNLAN